MRTWGLVGNSLSHGPSKGATKSKGGGRKDIALGLPRELGSA